MASSPESVRTKPIGLMEYDVDVFERLNRFHVAKEFLKKHSFSITQLGDIICSFGFEQFFGINLLHKHFDLDGDEKVVRQFENNVAYMRPYPASQFPHVVPYLWQFTSGQRGDGFYPLEFVELDDDYERQVALLQLEVLSGAHRFWRQLADKLTELGLTETFGVAALDSSRETLVVKEGEALLETTDEARRILTLEPVPESTVESLDTTQTLWIFTPPGDSTA